MDLSKQKKLQENLQKSDDIFPGPLSLGSWNWKEKKNPNKKRKATCNYFHNQTYLLVNCPSDLQQP